MTSSTNFLIHAILVGIGVTFAFYSSFIEHLKYKHAKQGFPLLPPYPKSRFQRRIFAYLVLVIFLVFFLIGGYHLPLSNNPITYVLFWWFSFSLLLTIFLIPALDLRETLTELSKQSFSQKTDNPNEIVLRIQRPFGQEEVKIEENTGEDSNGPGTMH